MQYPESMKCILEAPFDSTDAWLWIWLICMFIWWGRSCDLNIAALIRHALCLVGGGISFLSLEKIPMIWIRGICKKQQRPKFMNAFAQVELFDLPSSFMHQKRPSHVCMYVHQQKCHFLMGASHAFIQEKRKQNIVVTFHFWRGI